MGQCSGHVLGGGRGPDGHQMIFEGAGALNDFIHS